MVCVRGGMCCRAGAGLKTAPACIEGSTAGGFPLAGGYGSLVAIAELGLERVFVGCHNPTKQQKQPGA